MDRNHKHAFSLRSSFLKTTEDMMSKLIAMTTIAVQYLRFRVLSNQHWHEAVLIPCL